MILTNADGRKEIDLLPPSDSASSAMPSPVCPQGTPETLSEAGFEEPPLPGESPLDEAFGPEGGEQ